MNMDLASIPIPKRSVAMNSGQEMYRRVKKLEATLLSTMGENTYYAMTKFGGFFYKGYIWHPNVKGALKWDTCHTWVLSKAEANKFIKSQALTQVTLQELIENWKLHCLLDGREIERDFIEAYDRHAVPSEAAWDEGMR